MAKKQELAQWVQYQTNDPNDEDPESKRTAYYQKVTKETSWEHPQQRFVRVEAVAVPAETAEN